MNPEKSILTHCSLLKKEGDLYKFELRFSGSKDASETDLDFLDNNFTGMFYSETEKHNLIIGKEYEWIFDGYDFLITGFSSKQELLKNIDIKKPIDVKTLEQLKKQTTLMDRISYRVGWFYYLSIVSLILTFIGWIYFLKKIKQ